MAFDDTLWNISTLMDRVYKNKLGHMRKNTSILRDYSLESVDTCLWEISDRSNNINNGVSFNIAYNLKHLKRNFILVYGSGEYKIISSLSMKSLLANTMRSISLERR